jgi:signal transduction histidine kinase/integral membrane sensor domain MASE1/ActR/RegA family two-component response regulator
MIGLPSTRVEGTKSEAGKLSHRSLMPAGPHTTLKPEPRELVAMLALAALYFIAGKFGLSLAIIHPSASMVWPPSGLAFAAVLLWGYRLWPGVFLGAFLVNITTQGTLLTTLGIAAGNTLESLLGAWLIQQFANGPKVFERARNIFKFVLLAAFLSTTVSATFGVTSLALGGYVPWSSYGDIWLTWWLGDITGVLLAGPVLVIWATQPYPTLKLSRILEAVGLLLTLALTGYFAFMYQTRPGLEFLAILPLLWAAFRYGQRGAVTAAFLTFAVALTGVLRGTGPFATGETHQSLLYLQGFTGTIAMAALVLASVVTEHARTEQRLEVQEAVSRILADSPDLQNASSKILQVLCERAKWSSGALWYVDREANQLSCLEVWQVPSLEAPLFEADSRQRKFASGVGLPGRVWQSAEPTWIPDVTKDGNFPRAPLAAQEGLRAAFGFPINVGGEAVGMIECFSREVRALDDDFLRITGDIGSQVGRFIERRRSEELLAQAKDDLLKANEQLERRVQRRTADLERANTALVKNLEDQKKLEQQLRQAQKMESIGTLAGGIAHDFNNSLNIIKAYAMLLRARYPADQQILDSVKIIDEEIERGASVVRQLLTLARKTETLLRPTDANSIVVSVSELIKQIFPRTIEVRLNLGSTLPAVLADSNQINQALLNICVNARDAMPTGGELILATERIEADRMQRLVTEDAIDPYVCISIIDNGLGMEEGVRSRIFEPFFTTKGFGEGTGLGLAMVYGIMRNHHGVVDVESEPGRGSTFRLYLPVVQQSQPSPLTGSPTGDTLPAKSASHRGTVLVVEDEQPMVLLLTNALVKAGYQSIIAMDGEEAIELYRQNRDKIDIVLMDLGLPKVTGADVIRFMKKQDPTTKIIVTTGYLEPELKSELFGTGVKDYIHKPYSVDAVIKTVQSALSSA